MLLYTSNRNVDSGLLGVRPLSEAQVAEYRFWRPCGRRVCVLGCGGEHEGELTAAKRLFKDADEVATAQPKSILACDARTEANATDKHYRCEGVNVKASIWAGRRLVTDWSQFLGGCEREGVAPF